MKKSAIFAGIGAVAITGVMATNAFAHPNAYTVSVNGSTANADTMGYAVTQVLPSGKGVDFSVDNGSTIVTMGCTQAEAEGVVHGGTGKDPQATIKAVTRANTPEGFDRVNMKGCIGPFNTPMTVQFLTDVEMHATGTATTGTETVAGYLSGPSNGTLQAKVYATAGGPSGTSCNFTVSGTNVAGAFNEATQTLSIADTGYSGNLTVTSALGTCLGQVPVGSVADFTANFKLGKDSATNTKTSITDLLAVNLS